MIYIVHLCLSYPAHPVSEQLTSRVHPPSSCALVVKGSQQLR